MSNIAIILKGTSYDTRFHTVLLSPEPNPDMVELYHEFVKETGFEDVFDDVTFDLWQSFGKSWEWAHQPIYAEEVFVEWLKARRGFTTTKYSTFEMDDVE